MIRDLDNKDREILGHLQKDGRISNVELSKRVNLSPTPCLERVRRLERDGFITGYHARLDPVKMGQGLLVFVEVELETTSEDVFIHFKEAVKSIEQVMECHMIAGGFDYLLKLRFTDMQDYRNFLGHVLSALPHIKSTKTFVCMEEVKATTDLRTALK
jgi:Lrp/AsnC family leucine-responsive transcriptional regulator